MKNISYKFLKYPNLLRYDSTITHKHFFKEDIEYNTGDFKLSNKSRYVISSDCIPNYNYISTLEETICDDGFIITTCQESILLINVGENVYFLASCLVNDHKLYSMLYTFMENHQCVIDVSKFKHLFPMKILVPLFEKEND